MNELLSLLKVLFSNLNTGACFIVSMYVIASEILQSSFIICSFTALVIRLLLYFIYASA